jgi:Acyltransferase
VPLLLISLRGQRKIAFLSDWMYFHVPVFGWALRRSGAIPVWTKPAKVPGLHWLRPSRRASPLKIAAERLAAGKAVALYPEGRRNADPQRLLPGRPGLARLALETGVCIVPVGVDYAGREAGLAPPAFPRLTVRIGEALTVDTERAAMAQQPDSRQAIEDQLTARIMRSLAGLSGKGVATPDASEGPRMERPQAPALEARKIELSSDSEDARQLVQDVYVREKGWLSAATLDAFAGGASISWFIVRVQGEPAGLLRVVYDPPLNFPPGYHVELRKDVDWASLAASARVAEVGRFMIIEKHRRNPRVAVELMRTAVREIVERDYTHLVTDVFEGDPHSPYEFHTRVLGFAEIGSHTHGELQSDRKRIILAVDIDQAFVRMQNRNDRFYRRFTEGYRHLLEARQAAPKRRDLVAG